MSSNKKPYITIRILWLLLILFPRTNHGTQRPHRTASASIYGSFSNSRVIYVRSIDDRQTNRFLLVPCSFGEYCNNFFATPPPHEANYLHKGLILRLFIDPICRFGKTYGCTKEACSFRDALSNDLFKNSGCQVVGISGDTVAKQKVGSIKS